MADLYQKLHKQWKQGQTQGQNQDRQNQERQDQDRPSQASSKNSRAKSETEEKKDLAQEIEAFLDRLTTHPVFLESVSSLLNLNSYRKIFFKRSLQQIWKAMELPNKQDQEKTLYLVSELQFKIQKLEKQLAQARSGANPETINTPITAAKASKKSILTALQ